MLLVVVLVVLLVLVLKDDEERPAKKDDDDTKLAAANILFNFNGVTNSDKKLSNLTFFQRVLIEKKTAFSAHKSAFLRVSSSILITTK